MKKRAVLIGLLLLLSFATNAEVSIATWNVRMLSTASRTDEELAVIAEIVARYDVVAVQEARDQEVLDRLLAFLPGYSYVVSKPVGRGVSERYAFFYRVGAVELLGTPFVISDPDDLFIREPYVASFRAGAFDFTLVTVHVIYGDSKTQRRAEVSLLDDIVEAVNWANGSEEDVLLLGDFNLDPTDEAWQMTGYAPLIPPTTATTISDASSYDNIWFDPTRTAELLPVGLVYRFDELLFADDDRAASLAVSDHRPVSVTAVTSGPDDDAGGVFGDALREAMQGTPWGTLP
ncbi:MAG: endonuclease/exonuclease/phosphatase family protein [Spirochaetales bacterium]